MAQSKVELFRSLHELRKPLIMANAFDIGSARMLVKLGFKAIATSSGGFAGTLGRRDGDITCKQAIDHAKSIADSVDVPVSADLENGFSHNPEDVANVVRHAINIGLAGCSIEDYSGNTGNPFYNIGQATERIKAAVEAIDASGRDFVLTARCEFFLRGSSDLKGLLNRLQAYQEAGASVLMAPGLPDIESIHTVCKNLDKPFNFMAGMPGRSFSVEQLARVGVRRISLATSLYRASMSGVLSAAREILDEGTFDYVDKCIPSNELANYIS